MTEEKAITVYSRPQLTPAVWDMIERVAPAIYQSRLFGVSSKEQAMVIMLKGFELGLSLTASFEFIHVIDGRPALSPRGALAIVLNSGLLEGMRIEEQKDACAVWMKRKDGPEYKMSWTIEDAKRADLITQEGSLKADGTRRGKSNWEKYPANMLKWRTIGYVIDVLFSDVCGGMKRSDELGADITPEGDTIDGSWRIAPTPAPTDQQPDVPVIESPKPSINLDALLARHGAEAIIAANDGRIPGTQEEIEAVAAKLEATNGNT